MISKYRKRIDDNEIIIRRLQKKDNFYSLARLISFIVFITALIFSVSTLNAMLIFITLILFVLFVRIIIIHLDNQNLLHRAQTLKTILENEISCLNLKSNSYYNGDFFQDPHHDYTTDMDVFGKNSLFHYINRCAKGVGNRALARWFTREYPPGQILERQKAVKEMAGMQNWYDELRVSLYDRRIKDFSKEHLPGIKKTVATPPHLKRWIMASYSLLILSILLIVFTPLSAVVLFVPVFFNFYLNSKMGKFTETIRAQVEGREKTIKDYKLILSSWEEKKFQSGYLKQLQAELVSGNQSATDAIKKLQSLSKKLDFSLSMLVGAVLNIFFIWDIIMCSRLAEWFDRYADKTATWFKVAGKAEALISLANLHNNHPDWCYPVFRDKEEFLFTGKSLGHPLIPKNERVCNDFILEKKKGSFLKIVTGSNMAGKSTFLRTIGVNIILAKTGAPVCAQQSELSFFRIMTYLTITDSLSENTSTFYREIQRLKKILDAARSDNNILLLLDEMLRGTNSADKAKGSIAITRELIQHKVPAIIATHNLELADMQNDHPKEIENYFFDIIIDEGQMRFDYKLKPGVCDTFNASLLLKEIGIDISM